MRDEALYYAEYRSLGKAYNACANVHYVPGVLGVN